MESSPALTCECGLPAMGRCTECGVLICREHSFFVEDDLLCAPDVEQRRRGDAQRRIDSFDAALRHLDEESARAVAAFLEEASGIAPDRVQVGRRQVPVPPQRRTLKERWSYGSFWDTHTDATTTYDYDVIPAHVVFHRESSDLSDPPIDSITTVWVFLSGVVAVTDSQVRQGRLFSTAKRSPITRQLHSDWQVQAADLASEGYEPWAPLPRFTRKPDAPVGALPFYCDEHGPLPGRPQTSAEIKATITWFTKALQDYLAKHRA